MTLRRLHRFVTVTALVAASLALGCNPDVPIEDLGSSEEAIQMGFNAPAGTNSVVIVQPLRCTGTAIRNSWVITAAGCERGVLPDGRPIMPEDLWIETTDGGERTYVDDVVVVHRYLGVTLLHLASPLSIGGSTSGHRVPFSTRSPSTLAGSYLQCFSYGAYGRPPSPLRLQRAYLPVATGTATAATLHMDANAGPQFLVQEDLGAACYDGTALVGVLRGVTQDLETGFSPPDALVSPVSSLAGTIELTLGETSSPLNDPRGNPWEIDLGDHAREHTFFGTTRGATHDGPTTACGCTSGPDVWFTFTLTAMELVYLDTAGSSFDTSLVLTTSSGTPIEGGCDDDAWCATGGFTSVRQSRVAVWLDPGTYYVAVGGCGSGDFRLHVQHIRRDSASYFYTGSRLTGTGTTSTFLLAGSRSTPSCAAGLGASGEDARWLLACGGETPTFSLCPWDGGSFVRSTSFDPVLYVRSARTAYEPMCNDDAPPGPAGEICTGTGGDASPYGSRISNLPLHRGIHALVVDERHTIGGMDYTLSYSAP